MVGFELNNVHIMKDLQGVSTCTGIVPLTRQNSAAGIGSYLGSVESVTG